MALFPVKSYLPGTLVQDLVEAGKEGDGGNGRCQNITDRLGEKDAEALICREAGQDKNQRDKQDDLPQTGQQEAVFGLTQRHKALLAGDLNAHGEDARHVDAHSPCGVFDEDSVRGKDARHHAGGQHHEQPEQGGIAEAEGELEIGRASCRERV